MRTQSTRAKPMSISAAARNGNASFERSADGQRLQELARPRPLHVDLRPARRHVGDEGVRARRIVPIARRIHVSAWRWAVSDATTQNRSSSSLVTVRSASSVPASLSHCVYVIVPGRAVDPVGRDLLEHAARVAPLAPRTSP